MDSRDSIFLVSLMIVIPYIVKAYILQVRLTTKDKIVLKYTPKKAFFLINIAFVLSLLNMFYVILQHFTTFTPPQKLTKLVYTRPELSPLDFLRFGP